MRHLKQLLHRVRHWFAGLLHPSRAEAAPGGDDQPLAEDRFLSGEFSQAGRRVSYRLFVPGRAAAAGAPLLMMLHGCTQDAEDFATGTRMNELARKAGVMVLYPTQSRLHNPGKCWNWFLKPNQGRGRGECGLLHALLQQVAQTHRADPAKLYVAGLSAGAAMAALLAAAYPDHLAAAGLHSGLRAGAAHDLPSAMQAMKEGAPRPPVAAPAAAQVPVIVFQGELDQTVNPRNAERIVEALTGPHPDWRALPVQTGRSVGGRDYSCHRFADARGQVQVESWRIAGSGHAWSGGDPAGSHTDPAGPDASAEILRFCLARRLALVQPEAAAA